MDTKEIYALERMETFVGDLQFSWSQVLGAISTSRHDRFTESSYRILFVDVYVIRIAILWGAYQYITVHIDISYVMYYDMMGW